MQPTAGQCCGNALNLLLGPANRRCRPVYERFEFIGIFVLDRSLALRFKSRNGLSRVRIARIHK